MPVTPKHAPAILPPLDSDHMEGTQVYAHPDGDDGHEICCQPPCCEPRNWRTGRQSGAREVTYPSQQRIQLVHQASATQPSDPEACGNNHRADDDPPQHRDHPGRLGRSFGNGSLVGFGVHANPPTLPSSTFTVQSVRWPKKCFGSPSGLGDSRIRYPDYLRGSTARSS